MGRRSKEDIQMAKKAYEKILNIANYYRNADQDYSEVQPQTPVIKTSTNKNY